VNVLDFALFGAPPAFAEPVLVGQRYFPSWDRYRQAFREIFERQYYTEYGPLNEQLEQKLQQFLGVKHAICVTSETVGLMMAADSMGLSGGVILPRYSPAASTQSLVWAGLEPVYCDVDLDTHQIYLDQVASLIDENVGAIMGVHLWGGACDPQALAQIAALHGIQLYFDAAHAFGCVVDGTHIGNFGRCEVLSFHQANILNATEGGCICTNDDELAARLRTMRSSSGAGEPVSVTKTVNGRMSEAQAAIALMNLEDFPANRKNNETLHRNYEIRLESVPGLQLIKPTGVSLSNFQCAVCRVNELEYGLSPKVLIALLNAENVCATLQPKYSRRLPDADSVGAPCIQLPIGAGMTVQEVERICTILTEAYRAAPAIRARVASS
jgi:dTDP-4-amino-4,6-dideoxygalactose transaminase